MNSSDPENKNNIEQSGYKGFWLYAGLMVNIILALSSLTIAWYFAYSIISNPFSISRVANLFVFDVALLLGTNRAFAVLQRFILGKKLRRTVGVVKWIATFLVPIFFAFTPNEIANNRSIALTKEYAAPLIQFIESQKEKLKHPPANITEGLKSAERSRPFTYYWGEKHFVLETYGGSIDMDGSTIYYSSTNNKWLQIHNDLKSTKRGKSYRKAIEGLNSVRFKF